MMRRLLERLRDKSGMPSRCSYRSLMMMRRSLRSSTIKALALLPRDARERSVIQTQKEETTSVRAFDESQLTGGGAETPLCTGYFM